jgi:hypothetical protein
LPHRGGSYPRTQFGEGDIRASLPRFEREALEANLALVALFYEQHDRIRLGTREAMLDDAYAA